MRENDFRWVLETLAEYGPWLNNRWGVDVEVFHRNGERIGRGYIYPNKWDGGPMVKGAGAGDACKRLTYDVIEQMFTMRDPSKAIESEKNGIIST